MLPVLFPDHEGARVPAAMRTAAMRDHSRMRRAGSGACIAFEGEVGSWTGCSIYDDRPVPCSAFEPSTAQEPTRWCDEARARHGLPPLHDVTV